MSLRSAVSAVLSSLFFSLLWLDVARGGNTTCISSELDWYTDVVGETPCELAHRLDTLLLLIPGYLGETYQRLQQVCWSDRACGKDRSIVTSSLHAGESGYWVRA